MTDTALPSLSEAIKMLTAKPLTEATKEDRLTAEILNVALGDKKAGAIRMAGAVFAKEVWAKNEEFLTQADYGDIAGAAESTAALWLTRFRQPPDALVEEIPDVRAGRQNRSRYVPATSFLEFIRRVRNRDGLTGDSGIVAAIAISMAEKKQMFANIGTPRRLADILGLNGAQAERTVAKRVDAMTDEDAHVLVSLGDGLFTFRGDEWAALTPPKTSDRVWLSQPRKADQSWSRRSSNVVAHPVSGANPVSEDPVSGSESGATYKLTNNTVSNSPTPPTSTQSISPSVSRKPSHAEPSQAPFVTATTSGGLRCEEDEEGSLGLERVSESPAATGPVPVAARASPPPSSSSRPVGAVAEPATHSFTEPPGEVKDAAAGRAGRYTRRLPYADFAALVDAAFADGRKPRISEGVDLVHAAVGHVAGPALLKDDGAVAEALRGWAKTWRSTSLPKSSMFTSLWGAAEKAADRSDPIGSLAYLNGVVKSEAAKYPAIAATETSTPQAEVEEDGAAVSEEADTWDTESMEAWELAISALLDDPAPVLDDPMTQDWYLAKIEAITRGVVREKSQVSFNIRPAPSVGPLASASRSENVEGEVLAQATTKSLATPTPDPAAAARNYHKTVKDLLAAHPDFVAKLRREVANAAPLHSNDQAVSQAVGGILCAIISANVPLDQVLNHVGRTSCRMMLVGQRFDGWGDKKDGRPINGLRRLVDDYLGTVTRQSEAAAAISRAAVGAASPSISDPKPKSQEADHGRDNV